MRALEIFLHHVIVLALAAPFAAAAWLGSRICARRAGACRASTRGCAAWRPGMPPGAPGMRESTGSRAAFSTLAIARDGHAQTYAAHAEVP